MIAPILTLSTILSTHIDSLSNLKIAAIVLGTAAFVATGLTISALIGRRFGVKGMQNPEDWKNKKISEIFLGYEIVETKILL